MSKIEIYSKSYCPYCHRAKAVLDAEGVAYHEIEITSGLLRKLLKQPRKAVA